MLSSNNTCTWWFRILPESSCVWWLVRKMSDHWAWRLSVRSYSLLRYIREMRKVTFDYAVHAGNFGIENVSVHSKAVWSFLQQEWNFSTESKERESLIGIIVLQYLTNRSYSLQVLIVGQVEIVKWIRIWRISVGQCEVNCDAERKLQSVEDVLQEWIFLLLLASLDCEYSSRWKLYRYMLYQLANHKLLFAEWCMWSVLVPIKGIDYRTWD